MRKHLKYWSKDVEKESLPKIHFCLWYLWYDIFALWYSFAYDIHYMMFLLYDIYLITIKLSAFKWLVISFKHKTYKTSINKLGLDLCQPQVWLKVEFILCLLISCSWSWTLEKGKNIIFKSSNTVGEQYSSNTSSLSCKYSFWILKNSFASNFFVPI